MPKLNVEPANSPLDEDDLFELRQKRREAAKSPSLSPSPQPVDPDFDPDFDPDNVVIRGAVSDDEEDEDDDNNKKLVKSGSIDDFSFKTHS